MAVAADLKLLLEGRPAVGKTTVVRRLAEQLREAGVMVGGFVTDELRESGRRIGFTVETFDGDHAVLAHVDFSGPPRVGKYGVDVPAFERIALPALARAAASEVVLIDEVGKMELASVPFRAAVDDCFGRRTVIVATVQLARHPVTDKLKGRRDVETIRVTASNRGQLPAQLAERIIGR